MRSRLPHRSLVLLLSTLLLASTSTFAGTALAQPTPDPAPTVDPVESTPPAAPPPSAPPPPPPPSPSPPEAAPSAPEPAPQPEENAAQMSEGRMLVSLYNSGFQWGISPGVIFSRGKAGFALGLRFGYGFDVGPVILVPGVRLAGYFMDPNVYLGMPTFKLVFPIDRFAPFIEGGAGVGHVADPSKSGLALMGGGGFMIHFNRFAFGAEASYQTISGTGFKGFGVGPILALGF